MKISRNAFFQRVIKGHGKEEGVRNTVAIDTNVTQLSPIIVRDDRMGTLVGTADVHEIPKHMWVANQDLHRSYVPVHANGPDVLFDGSLGRGVSAERED